MLKGQKKKNTSFGVNTIVTLLIVIILIISGPAQAVRVLLNPDGLSDLAVDEIGYFYVNITIGANERIPIANISVEGLPDIPGSPGGKLLFNVSDIHDPGNSLTRGNYKIILVARNGWVGGYGYGYGYDNNYGYQPYYGYGYGYGTGYGYGYGYGTGYGYGYGTGYDYGYGYGTGYGYGYGYGTGYGYGYGYGRSDSYTQLKYRIEVDTTGALEGQYDLTATVNTGKGVKFAGSSRFTLKAKKIIPAVVRIKPENLNLRKDKFKAYIELPEPYDVADINESSVVCEGAHIIKSDIKNGAFIAEFMTKDLVNITTGDAVNFTITGNLIDGTLFQGTDIIRVFSKDDDETPPAGVAGLNTTSFSWNSIDWSWSNPTDADFAKVKVYINGAFKKDVISSRNYYNATGLTPNTMYEISTQTVDNSGNINETWINHTAKTDILPAIVKIKPESLNLKKDEFKAFIELPEPYNVSDINESSVVCEGAHIIKSEIENGTFVARFMTKDLVNITTGDSVNFKITGNLKDITPFQGTDTIRVFSRGEIKENHGNGGGGGSNGISGENFDNIVMKERRDNYLFKKIFATYNFTEEDNPIDSVKMKSWINAGEVTVAVEVLKGKSVLAKARAPGTIYRNVNIHVGSAGFATEKNIDEAIIAFNVKNSWLNDKGFSGSDVRMVRWTGNDWEELVTAGVSKDIAYTHFETKTRKFSAFAIVVPGKETSWSTPVLFSSSMQADGTLDSDTGAKTQSGLISETQTSETQTGKQLLFLDNFLILIGIFVLVSNLNIANRKKKKK